jgi:hypothetical protein
MDCAKGNALLDKMRASCQFEIGDTLAFVYSNDDEFSVMMVCRNLFAFCGTRGITMPRSSHPNAEFARPVESKLHHYLQAVCIDSAKAASVC